MPKIKQSRRRTVSKQLSPYSIDPTIGLSYLRPIEPGIPSWEANIKGGKPGSDQEFVTQMRRVFFQHYFPPKYCHGPVLLTEALNGKSPKAIHKALLETNKLKYQVASQKLIQSVLDLDIDFLQRLTNGVRKIIKAQETLHDNPIHYIYLTYLRFWAEHSKPPTQLECRELAKRLWAIERLREREKYQFPNEIDEAAEKRIQRMIAQLPEVNWRRALRKIDLRLKPAKSGPKTRTG